MTHAEPGASASDTVASQREDGPRRLLMMCYFYPPVLAAGTQRSVAFATRLRATGWQPLILTVRRARSRWEAHGEPEPPGIDVVRTSEWDLTSVVLYAYGGVQTVLRLVGRPLARNHFFDWAFPDLQVAWRSTWTGIRLARRADCIYVSCSPFSSALSALRVKRWTGKPLVLDFRDAWSLNPHRRAPAYVQRWTKRAERTLLHHCDALVVNTEGARRLYAAAYPEYASKVVAIPNGFDALNLPSRESIAAPPRTPGDRFTIMHVGSFYGGRQPDLLLDALAEINDPRVEFLHVGPPFASEARYRDRVRLRRLDTVSNAEALKLMQQASLLYLKQGWEPGVRDYIAIASKSYEYLATGLPILADCPPGDNLELIRRYAHRAYLVDTETREAMIAALRAALAAPPEPPRVSESFIADFNRDGLTRRLADVLDAVVSGAPRARNASPDAPSESGNRIGQVPA
jgi:glycosyltransferase involved in cell wall biosynthesis